MEIKSPIIYKPCRANVHWVEKKTEVSEVFDAKRAPLIVLATSCATETHFIGHNLPIASTNLKLLT